MLSVWMYVYRYGYYFCNMYIGMDIWDIKLGCIVIYSNYRMYEILVRIYIYMLYNIICIYGN